MITKLLCDEKAKDKFDLSFSQLYLRAKIYIQATKVRESSLYNCFNVKWNNEMFPWVAFHMHIGKRNGQTVRMKTENGGWNLLRFSWNRGLNLAFKWWYPLYVYRIMTMFSYEFNLDIRFYKYPDIPTLAVGLLSMYCRECCCRVRLSDIVPYA